MKNLLTGLLLSDAVEKYSPDQPRDEKGRFGEGGGGREHQDVAESHGFKLHSGYKDDTRTGKPGPNQGHVMNVAEYKHFDGRRIVVTTTNTGRQNYSIWRNGKTKVPSAMGYTLEHLSTHLNSPEGQKSGASDTYHYGRKV